MQTHTKSVKRKIRKNDFHFDKYIRQQNGEKKINMYIEKNTQIVAINGGAVLYTN